MEAHVGSKEWLEDFFQTANTVAVMVGEKFGEGRLGGHIHLCVNPSGKELLHRKLGQPAEDKVKSTWAFSKEKNQRAMQYPEHVLSWQSRHPKKNQWGGSIKTPTLGISISGYPEDVDQSFDLSLAVYYKLLDYEEACGMAFTSGGEEHVTLFANIFAEIVTALRKTKKM
ncbi:MAG: hypothetical protein JKX80_01510 [Candidatus Pacebacteria bacterium]|nr:hypothetical protein [Candidatus Paceibacterota bacterium]